MWHSRLPRDPPPFMANAILNFHFDFWHPSLTVSAKMSKIDQDHLLRKMLSIRTSCKAVVQKDNLKRKKKVVRDDNRRWNK